MSQPISTLAVAGKPGRYRSGQTGRTVNPLAYAFTGSNPVLPTISPLGAAQSGAWANISGQIRRSLEEAIVSIRSAPFRSHFPLDGVEFPCSEYRRRIE